MADDLKPCPFCGGEGRIESYYVGHRAIECGQCAASIPVHDLAMAIAAWNRRAAPSSPVADDGRNALVSARAWIIKNRPALTLSRQVTIDEYLALLEQIDAAMRAAAPQPPKEKA